MILLVRILLCHTLNILDEQKIIVDCFGVMLRFRMFAFDFRLLRLLLFYNCY